VKDVIHICRGPRKMWSRCGIRIASGVKCMSAKEYRLGVEVIAHAGGFALVTAVCVECVRRLG
jgi:hypothetical protein